MTSEEDQENLSDFVALTEVVREHYTRYLQRQLQENVLAWANESRNHHKPTAWASIPEAIEILDTKALNACRAAKIYQRIMIELIAAVRRSTRQCRLADVIFRSMQNEQKYSATSAAPELVEQSTQTANYEIETDERIPTSTVELGGVSERLTLEQKIDLFQSEYNLDGDGVSNHSQIAEANGPIQSSPVAANDLATEAKADEDDDTVAQELALMFSEEPSELNEIFGIEPTAITDDPQVCDILKEIQSAPTPTSSPIPASPPQIKTPKKTDLRYSPWPCELYAQRRKLNTCLVRLLESNWRAGPQLKSKFEMLFGKSEDSDDEFNTCITSPSIDLVDKELLSSCIFRIRPWIVRYLMRPFENGLIANSFLFKKLAKSLAHKIVLANPYASERQVKSVIENFFCIKVTGVQCAKDLIDLPAINRLPDDYDEEMDLIST